MAERIVDLTIDLISNALGHETNRTETGLAEAERAVAQQVLQ